MKFVNRDIFNRFVKYCITRSTQVRSFKSGFRLDFCTVSVPNLKVLVYFCNLSKITKL